MARKLFVLYFNTQILNHNKINKLLNNTPPPPNMFGVREFVFESAVTAGSAELQIA